MSRKVHKNGAFKFNFHNKKDKVEILQNQDRLHTNVHNTFYFGQHLKYSFQPNLEKHEKKKSRFTKSLEYDIKDTLKLKVPINLRDVDRTLCENLKQNIGRYTTLEQKLQKQTLQEHQLKIHTMRQSLVKQAKQAKIKFGIDIE